MLAPPATSPGLEVRGNKCNSKMAPVVEPVDEESGLSRERMARLPLELTLPSPNSMGRSLSGVNINMDGPARGHRRSKTCS